MAMHVGAEGDAKLFTAFQVDGVGDLKPPVLAPALFVVSADEAGNGIGAAPGNPVLTVDNANHTIGSIGTNGDQDYYQVTLTAGVTYQIGMYGYTGPAGSPGPGGAPLADAYVEIRSANGTTAGALVTSADGGANTPANTVNSGFDVLLTFTPETSGTYYINARAYDNDPTDGTTGEGVGDYELFVNTVDPNDPSVYRPYYEVDSPLYSLDWGTQVNKVNQSVRNPDGNEGTRDTGNAPGTPIYGSAVDVPALAAAQGVNIAGKNVITIYFAKAGDVFASNDPTNPGLPPATITAVGVQQFERDAVFTALAQFEKVADIVYLEVQDRNQADFVYTSYQGTPGPGVSLLGSMSPPDESDEGLAQFNSGDSRWNARDLAQGGFSFVTLIHEFGHGHGMAHPHDNGGRSGIMNGVEAEGAAFDYTTGDFDLNQAVFTMMSYEDGWPKSPYGNAPTNAGYGYLGGLMAFDIAVIQDKYGVNEEWATGDNVYTLKDVNAAGTFYESIWDAGGNDTIVYDGARNATIDLRAATLQYEPGGGGNVSFAFGIFGGFTIANGVTIENATGGSGNDLLRGNSGANVLNGRGGLDTFFFGADFTAADTVDGGEGADVLALQGDYSGGVSFGTGTVSNITSIASVSLYSGGNASFGDTANNRYSYNLTTLDGNVAAGETLRINGAHLLAGEDLIFNGSAESNGAFQVYGGQGVDTLTGGGQGDNFIFAHDGRFAAGDTIVGGGGYDVVYLRGDYVIDFSAAGYAGALSGVESIGLLSASSTLYAGGGDGEFDYVIDWDDDLLASGATMTINGSRLTANETMDFDGSSEQGGNFRLFGGAATDVLRGGTGNDLIFGGTGNDTMTGGGGNDVFRYQSANESTTNARDGIGDFTLGDRIDLSTIDAIAGTPANDAFSFIGSGAFTNKAGELRAEKTENTPFWTVSGDIDGDGIADFEVVVTVTDNHPLSGSDFLL